VLPPAAAPPAHRTKSPVEDRGFFSVEIGTPIEFDEGVGLLAWPFTFTSWLYSGHETEWAAPSQRSGNMLDEAAWIGQAVAAPSLNHGHRRDSAGGSEPDFSPCFFADRPRLNTCGREGRAP